jgi:nucleotide-binding universal stress UspA family protein
MSPRVEGPRKSSCHRVSTQPLSERAIHASIELAIQLGASITGFTVGRLPVSLLRRSSDMMEDDDSDDETATAASAHRILAHFASCAQAAGVPYEGVYHQAPRVDRAIIETAESHGCDMILMVTHGRGAFGEFLYGSQTKAVLAASKLPLLILK